MSTQFDIAVVGGGLAGKAAAVASSRSGFATLHIAPVAGEDRRTSALMGASVDYLVASGLIAEPATLGTPLKRIRIIDATGRFLRAPETVFDSRELKMDAFGWNFPNSVLNTHFAQAEAGESALAHATAALVSARRADGYWTLDLDDGSRVKAALLVGADGKHSRVRDNAGITVRERVYDQAALVCDLELDRSLNGESVEFHYPDGPFTLVPAGDKNANLVWIDKRGVLDAARADAAGFTKDLAEKSMGLFGAPRVVSPSVVFPLSSLRVDTAGRDGAVLVGEAAHAFPPIGAQGLNLGLRDVADLDAALLAANPSSYGWADAVTRDYARRRAGDLTRTGGFVDGLFHSLLSPHLPAQFLRSAGLWGMNILPPLRRSAMAFGLGR